MKFAAWGLGLQSTTMLVMAAKGLIDQPDYIISADPGMETTESYRMRDFYSAYFEQHNLATVILPAADIAAEGAAAHVHIPFFTTGGPLRRQCTRYFKIEPMRRAARILAGYDERRPPHPKAGEFEMMIGFSWDEVERMKADRVKYMVSRYPLIEEYRMTRNQCAQYLESEGLPVPGKSACICCPYRRSSEWLRMKQEAPDDFARAVAFDAANRHNPHLKNEGVASDELYLYKGRVPLAEADLAADARREKQGKQMKLFHICGDGLCHV